MFSSDQVKGIDSHGVGGGMLLTEYHRAKERSIHQYQATSSVSLSLPNTKPTHASKAETDGLVGLGELCLCVFLDVCVRHHIPCGMSIGDCWPLCYLLACNDFC